MKSKTVSRCALSMGAAAWLVSCGGSQVPIVAPNAMPQSHVYASAAEVHSKTFNYTGGEQSFKVPDGVTSVTVDARGAAGGGGYASLGGRVVAVIPVKPAELLHIYVGGEGNGTAGGFNGGGNGAGEGNAVGYGGGGASDVREGGTRLKNRDIVAGGAGGFADEGGGSSGGGIGGDGGKRTGASGNPGDSNGSEAYAGGGGGGGGSSYVESRATQTQMWRGWKNANGNGLVILSWK